MTTAQILAIDLGLRSGFAALDAHGRLVSYRSTNFGSRSRLRKAAWGVLREFDGLAEVVAEGDRNLAAIWRGVADKQGVALVDVAPETWRRELRVPRQRRSGADAKDAADQLARAFIDHCGLPGPTSLRHDAAEAICIAVWRGVFTDLPVCSEFVADV
jgi:hypothetical protein